jgi:MFS transporter, AAHS family, 4-hydroxybenzoate transporter
MSGASQIAADAKGSPNFWRVMALCSAIALLDGYDTQAIAFVAPVLAKQWGVGKEAFGIAFAAALVGLTLGTTIFGPVADRIGRKPVLTLATGIFAVFSIATAWSDSLMELAAWRFLTGLGLGAAIPNLIALTSEHAPGHRRALAAGAMFCGFPLGSIICGLISPGLIGAYGWQSIFLIGGIIPLCLVPIVHFFLVESPAWHQGAQAGQSVRSPVRALFSKQMIGLTPLLWLAFFCGLLVMYFLVNWLPSIFTDAGLSLKAASQTTVILNTGGIIGCLILMPLIDRFGAQLVLPGTYCLGAVAIAMIGSLQPGSTAILLAIFVAGFCVVGGQFGGNAFAAAVHPTELRSTGLGWALGIGRIGSIVGPVFGGLLLGTGMAMGSLFLIVAAIALLAALTFFIITGSYNVRH